MKINFKEIFYCPIKDICTSVKLFWLLITNFKLYNRWVKIQYIKSERLRKEQEAKEKAEWENLLKEAEIKSKIPYKRTHTREQRIRRVIFVRIKRRVWKFLKPLFSFLFKFIGWGALYLFLDITSSHNSEYGDRLNYWLTIGIFIYIILFHKAEKENYKSWQSQAKYDEFHKIFCDLWKPSITNYLIAFWFGLKFCNNFEFVILMIIIRSLSLWDRRFITNDIKQDIILKRLK